MPPRLPSQLRNLPKSITTSSSSSPTAAAIITNTTTPVIRRCLAAQSHTEGHPEEMYDPPSGWLFGVPPGEKHKKEGWETVSYIGIVGALVAATVAYAYKPDTSIQTWALEEARRRLEAEGILPEPTSSKK